jgi:putative ABC transport system permease protein
MPGGDVVGVFELYQFVHCAAVVKDKGGGYPKGFRGDAAADLRSVHYGSGAGELFSLVFSLLLLWGFQQLFSGLWLNHVLGISFHYTVRIFLIFLGFSIAVGVVAGALPSFYISLFNPVNMLRGAGAFRGMKRLTLRKVLLVVQLCVSLIFIISTSLDLFAGEPVMNMDYGFNKENVVDIKLVKTENYNRFAHAIAANKGVGAVAACTFPPATGVNNQERIHKADAPLDSLQANYIDIDAGCLSVWGLNWSRVKICR